MRGRSWFGVSLAIFFGLVLGYCAPAHAENTRAAPWPASFHKTNGEPLHRATVVATAGTPKDTSNTSGGASVTFTSWTGGERICVTTTAAAYVEVIASGSMTASGGKAFTVNANESLFANCFTLRGGTGIKISVDCVSGACAAVKFFELR